MKPSNRPAHIVPLVSILLACSVAAIAQEAPTDGVAAALGSQAEPADEGKGSEFGTPLVIDGKRISDLEIKRYLIYGPGQSALNTFRIDTLIQVERAQREARGVDPKTLVLPEEIFQQAYDREITNFKERFPTLDVDTEVGRAYRSVDLYKRQLHQTLQFDWLFFPPGAPADWSDLTKEAINTGVMVGQQPGAAFIDLIADSQDNWQRRKEFAEQSGAVFEDTGDEVAMRTKYALLLEPEDEMFMGLLRDYMLQTLGTQVETKTATDGLPEDVVMTVDGQDVHASYGTEEVYEVIRPTVTEREIADTKLFLALMQATENELAAHVVPEVDANGHTVDVTKNFLLPKEAYQAEIAEMVESMRKSMFTFDFVALQGYQFPSLEAYERHLYLQRSFEKMIEPTLANGPEDALSPVLEEHLKKANLIMGLSRVDAEVMLISAFDFLHNKWKENGWAWAETEATRLKTELDAHIEKLAQYDEQRRKASDSGENIDPSLEVPQSFERFWAEMMDLHSDYWDAPMPAKGKPPAMQGMKLKGRFGAQTRNDLERYVGETAYTLFLTDDAVTDKIFFDMQVGTIAGPFIGPQGYYIVYLKNRATPTNPLMRSEPRHMDLLRDDYIRREFTHFAHQCLNKSETSGL